MQRVINYCIEKITQITGNEQTSKLIVVLGFLLLAILIIWLVMPAPTPEDLFDPSSVDIELQAP